MNDEKNKELEESSNDNVNELVSVVSNDMNISGSVGGENSTTNSNVVEEVSFDYPEQEVIQEESKDADTQQEQIVVAASTSENVKTTIVEVSTTSTSLDEIEISNNSVFNDANKSDEIVSGSLKEGQEYRADKKGFPYGMVIGFVILIICAFFIDNIVGFVEDNLLPKNGAVEEEATKKDEGKDGDIAKPKEDINIDVGNSSDIDSDISS